MNNQQNNVIGRSLLCGTAISAVMLFAVNWNLGDIWLPAVWGGHWLAVVMSISYLFLVIASFGLAYYLAHQAVGPQASATIVILVACGVLIVSYLIKPWLTVLLES
jgi:hypothetical protein